MTLKDFLDKYKVSKKDREYAEKVYEKHITETEETWKKMLEKSIRLIEPEPTTTTTTSNNKNKDKEK